MVIGARLKIANHAKTLSACMVREFSFGGYMSAIVITMLLMVVAVVFIPYLVWSAVDRQTRQNYKLEDKEKYEKMDKGS